MHALTFVPVKKIRHDWHNIVLRRLSLSMETQAMIKLAGDASNCLSHVAGCTKTRETRHPHTCHSNIMKRNAHADHSSV